MSGLGRPFTSLPITREHPDPGQGSAEGSRALLSSHRSAPLPGTGAGPIPLPELAQQIANAERANPDNALRRLQTFNTVKQALGRVPHPEDEKQTFIGRLASRLTSFVGRTQRQSGKERDSAEVRHVAFLTLLKTHGNHKKEIFNRHVNHALHG